MDLAIKLIVLVIVIFVLSQLNQWSILDKVFFALVGVLAVAMLWSRFSLVGLVLTRDTRTDRAQVGQPLVERVRIENRSRLSKLWVELVDHSRARVVLRLRPRQRRERLGVGAVGWVPRGRGRGEERPRRRCPSIEARPSGPEGPGPQ